MAQAPQAQHGHKEGEQLYRIHFTTQTNAMTVNTATIIMELSTAYHSVRQHVSVTTADKLTKDFQVVLITITAIRTKGKPWIVTYLLTNNETMK